MRIGIDARFLSQWKAGSSVFLESIVPELARIDGENDYYLYSNRAFDLRFENRRWWKRICPSPRFVPGTLWLQMQGRRMVVKDDLDLFWGPGEALPLGLPAGLGKILTVHDFVWRLYPETMSWSTYVSRRLFQERFIREADRLVTVSQSTGRDLMRLFGLPRGRISTIYHGVGSNYRARDLQASAQHIGGKFGVSDNYICAVGTIEPRKNLTTLVEAIKILRSRREVRHQLVIVGATGWKQSKIYGSVERCGLTQKDVVFLGRIPEEDMPFLYSGAAVFVFPSLYEGFGLPLVEAMASGVPIVASDATPVPEIVEDAALLVSPDSAEDFADAISRVSKDCELRQTLIERGLRRASKFRWHTAATELLEVFEDVRRNLRPFC